MPSLKDYKPLRLLIEDADDLKILSSVLQDAIAKIGDFAYISAQRRFAFVANRFIWEDAARKRRETYGRVRVGCHFDDVVSAQQYNLRPDFKEGIVDLLTIRFEPGVDGAGVVMLDFAGGGAIRLEVESLNAQLSDISEPWMTRARPDHET